MTRTVTKWTRACDKRLTRLISSCCHVGQYSTVLEIQTIPRLRTMKTQNRPRSGFCVSWEVEHSLCKEQTSVSHGSIESEVISLDAGLRMDGSPALDLWDLVIEVLHTLLNQPDGHWGVNTTHREQTFSCV